MPAHALMKNFPIYLQGAVKWDLFSAQISLFQALKISYLFNMDLSVMARNCRLFIFIRVVHHTQSRQCGSHQHLKFFACGRAACLLHIQHAMPYCEMHQCDLPLHKYLQKHTCQLLIVRIQKIEIKNPGDFIKIQKIFETK